VLSPDLDTRWYHQHVVAAESTLTRHVMQLLSIWHYQLAYFGYYIVDASLHNLPLMGQWRKICLLEFFLNSNNSTWILTHHLKYLWTWLSSLSQHCLLWLWIRQQNFPLYYTTVSHVFPVYHLVASLEVLVQRCITYRKLKSRRYIMQLASRT
jgi:hypothetical protein